MTGLLKQGVSLIFKMLLCLDIPFPTLFHIDPVLDQFEFESNIQAERPNKAEEDTV